MAKLTKDQRKKIESDIGELEDEDKDWLRGLLGIDGSALEEIKDGILELLKTGAGKKKKGFFDL